MSGVFMTGREKIFAAFSRDGTPEIGAAIYHEGLYVRDRWDDISGCPWWFALSPRIEEQLAWRRDMVERLSADWMMIAACAPRAARERLSIETADGNVYLVDDGANTKAPLLKPAVGGAAACPARSPDVMPCDKADVDKLIPAATSFDARRFREQGCADLADALCAAFPSQFFFAYVDAPIWKLSDLFGFDQYMMLMAERPDLMERAAERRFARTLNAVAQAGALRADAVWIVDCFWDMVSPAAFQNLNLPWLIKLRDAVRDLGMKSIYHYCGNPWNHMAAILGAGFDALALEDGKKGFRIEIEAVTEAVQKRQVVFGNLDPIGVLEKGSDSDLELEIKRQIAAGRAHGGRFVMNLGSPITPATPAARVRRYCDIVHRLASGGK